MIVDTPLDEKQFHVPLQNCTTARSINCPGFPRESPLKRVAIVLQVASTGGWRFATRLMEGMRTVCPNVELHCYLGAQVHQVFHYENPEMRVRSMGVTPHLWSPTELEPTKKARNFIRSFMDSRKARRFKRELDQQTQELNGYDLVFFAWPYAIECPDLSVPMAFLPHDFNYTHFMGVFNVHRIHYEQMKASHARWLQRATPVVSTPFIARDLQRNFPEYPQTPQVIYLARLSGTGRLEEGHARKVVSAMGIEGDYILNINNISYHKNLGQIIGGFHYASERYPELKLIVAGYDTMGIRGRATTSLYLDNCDENWNVLSVGMRTDEEIAALIQCARLVINGSLYEAGNGSGLDAWYIGTPVAMSNIPSFADQMAFLDTRAALFHPRCCFEIRDAILRILDDETAADEMVSQSCTAMQRYDWVQVASQYLSFFEKVANHAS